MEVLPICLKLYDRTVLVVGGGAVAARKIHLVRRAHGRIRLVAPSLSRELSDLLRRDPAISHAARPFAASDLDGVVAAIAATNDRTVNRRVSDLAQARQIPVNVVDDPELCSFLMPALVDRGSVVAAISTGGASPVLARLLRLRVELALPPGIDRLARFAALWRARVHAAIPDETKRRRFWEIFLAGPLAARIEAGGAEPDLDPLIARADTDVAKIGRDVLFVPIDDPESVSLRVVRALQRADHIIHSPEIPALILDLARRDATRHVLSGPLEATLAGLAPDHTVLVLLPQGSPVVSADDRLPSGVGTPCVVQDAGMAHLGPH